MAMNKNLKEGTILFLSHSSSYLSREHEKGNDKYSVYFKALYVQNRRERTTGASVPRSLVPALTKLGIRINDFGGDTVTAIGCRHYPYHRVNSAFPYPAGHLVMEAQKELERQLETLTASNEGVRLMNNPFIDLFKEKKMSNKDALYTLQKPLQDYLANETHVG